MTFSRLFAALTLFGWFTVSGLQGQAVLDSLTSDLNIEGLETSFDPTTGLAIAKGDVRISYTDVEIRCGQASYNQMTGEVIARDKVIIWKSGITYKGENILYNANSGEISGDAVRSSQAMDLGSLFFQTDRFDTETKLSQKLEGTDTYLTTHDSENPNFRLRARGLTVIPEDKVILRNVTVLAGNVPVFYLPYLSQSLEAEAGYKFNFGQQSRWGAFMLNQYDVIHGDHTRARYHLDLRSARGVGVGVDLFSMRYRNNWNNFSGLKLYYQNDTDPTKNRTSVPRGPVPQNRYRVNFQHRIYLPGPEQSTWYLDFDINKISDAHFYEDFFFNDFRETPQPDNQVSLVHRTDSYLATLMTRFQANNFYRVGEKLPELSIDWTRRPLWNTGIYHQGTASIGYMRELASDLEQSAYRASLKGAAGGVLNDSESNFIRNLLERKDDAALGLNDYNNVFGMLAGGASEYARLHTYHEFLYPKTLGGWLNVVPRLGAGFTHYAGYSRTLNGLYDGFSQKTRPILHAGLDVSFKLTKTWSDYTNESLGLDGLRHVFQPYVNYSYLDASMPDGFVGVDRLSPTTRPRPIDIPLYSAVDSLRSWNITRLGFKNFLQTRRDYTVEANGRFASANDDPVQTYTFAGMNTYVDLFAKDPEFNRDMSNLYNELFFRPVPWVNIWMDMQLPITSKDGNFTEFNQGITFMPSDAMSFTLGHQFVNDSPYFQDSSLVFARTYARLTENWGVSMYHVYEMDDSTLEFQSYSITRDLTSWVASIGAMQRDNRNGQTEFGLIFSLTLKDFPGASIPLDIDPNPSGRGGSQSQ